MLFENMRLDSDTDFKILGTRHPGGKFKHEVIIAPLPKGYPGHLKSSELVPAGYDYYVYLDSDVLCFGNPGDLIDPAKDFSIVHDERPMLDRWFAYEKAPREDKVKMQSLMGINAGTFCFRDLGFLETIRNLLYPLGANVSSLQGWMMLEQSSFNYALAKAVDFDLARCHDLTPVTQLQAQVRPYVQSKYLYHFTGAPNTMAGKAYVMGEFLKRTPGWGYTPTPQVATPTP